MRCGKAAAIVGTATYGQYWAKPDLCWIERMSLQSSTVMALSLQR